MSSLSTAILDAKVNDRKSCREIDELRNFDYVRVIKSDYNSLILDVELHIYLNRFSSSKIEEYGIIESNFPITLFDMFGLNEEYKYIFSQLMDITDFSKEKLSELIRYNIVCETFDSEEIYFEFNLSKSLISE